MQFKMRYVHPKKVGDKTYHYYRRDGRYWGRLPGDPGSVEFAREYERINAQFEDIPTQAGEFGELINNYLKSVEYKSKAEATRRLYRHTIDQEKVGIRSVFGPYSFEEVDRASILAWRDKLAPKPGVANCGIVTMQALFAWAIDRGYIKYNPTQRIKPLKIGEYKPWPIEAIEHFRQNAKPEFVWGMEIGLWTSQRISDVVPLNWNQIKDGWIYFKQKKTGAELHIPISTPLQAVLDEIPRRSVRVLTMSSGRVWTVANFRKNFHAEAERLGLGEYKFHGFRKNTAQALIEYGASEKEAKSVTGQKSTRVLDHYSKGARQKVLAMAAMERLEVGNAFGKSGK